MKCDTPVTVFSRKESIRRKNFKTFVHVYVGLYNNYANNNVFVPELHKENGVQNERKLHNEN
jgi:hypothetical protein